MPRPSVETLEERKRALRRVRTDPADCEAHITHALLSEGLDIAALAAQACLLPQLALSCCFLMTPMLRRWLLQVGLARLTDLCRALSTGIVSRAASHGWQVHSKRRLVHWGASLMGCCLVSGDCYLNPSAVTACRCSST